MLLQMKKMNATQLEALANDDPAKVETDVFISWTQKVMDDFL